nr:MAG TPA: hypothetical protein [Inoviridae sp.]
MVKIITGLSAKYSVKRRKKIHSDLVVKYSFEFIK